MSERLPFNLLPRSPHLQTHFGTWHQTRGSRRETVKVRGPLSTNDSETALLWALADFGTLLHSKWDANDHRVSGHLQQVIEDWTLPVADIFAVYSERMNLSAKVSTFIDFMTYWFRQNADGHGIER
jgi:LysR family transcriptional regulator, transcriptional activator for dmlA